MKKVPYFIYQTINEIKRDIRKQSWKKEGLLPPELVEKLCKQIEEDIRTEMEMKP
jgi:hypothetical protein